MSEKRLFKFQQESDYNTAKRNHLIVPNISTVVESGNTYINPKFVPREAAESGDIIVYHGDEVRYMKPEAFDQNDSFWTPDAIVVVPYKHTNDGTVRAMALNYASTSTPSTGGSGQDIVFGLKNINDNSNIKKYGLFTRFASINDQTPESTISLSGDGYLPSDSFEGTPNPFDKKTNYSSNASNSGAILSSPFNNYGLLSDAYASRGDFETFTGNPFQDMNGKETTKEILKVIDSNNIADILYSQTIINAVETQVGGENIYLHPCVCACVRYSSVLKPCVFDAQNTLEENLMTMPWYLPSIGELGYYIARKGVIDYALQQIGKTMTQNNASLASATFAPGEGTRAVSSPDVYTAVTTTNGYVKYTDADTETLYAIPFCKF